MKNNTTSCGCLIGPIVLALLTCGCNQVVGSAVGARLQADRSEVARNGYRLATNLYWVNNNRDLHLIELSTSLMIGLGGSSSTPQFNAFVDDVIRPRNLCPRGWKRYTEQKSSAALSFYFTCV